MWRETKIAWRHGIVDRSSIWTPGIDVIAVGSLLKIRVKAPASMQFIFGKEISHVAIVCRVEAIRGHVCVWFVYVRSACSWFF